MEETIIVAVKSMCDRLANYHWSPEHPSTYVLPAGDGKYRGIGIIAEKNYGAFNLAWASCEGKWQTVAEQTKLITEFTRFQHMTHYKVNDVPLSDWLCFLRPKPFGIFILDRKALPIDVHSALREATQKAVAME